MYQSLQAATMPAYGTLLTVWRPWWLGWWAKGSSTMSWWLEDS